MKGQIQTIMKVTPLTEKFSKLFSELEDCNEIEQKQKILEMNEIIDRMEEEEFNSVVKTELFNEMHKMIEEKIMMMGNSILLLKHVGYCSRLKNIWYLCFEKSLLCKRLEKLIVDENERKEEEKDEKHFIDYCECYLMLLKSDAPIEMALICARCFLKVVLKKEKCKETQKEVEMALFALSCFHMYHFVKRELYLNEITEIIRYHQEHHNLTQLAYQSAWEFLIYRFQYDSNLKQIIGNELHFVREAKRELEELIRNEDWKRKEEEKGNTEVKVPLIWRWLDVIECYIISCELWNEEHAGLIGSIVQTFYAAKDNDREICDRCAFVLRRGAEKRKAKIGALLNEGAVCMLLGEMNQSTLDDEIIWNCLHFFMNILRRLKEKTDYKMEEEDDENEEVKNNEMEEAERKELKRQLFERTEEEGYEDCNTSFYGVISFVNEKYYDNLLLNISDYFVNV
ncbi:uncharacterized protein MONOS_18524 [Monocercomonoides exilis]|uniref:uncharacterized protein n=1 Tax=Monocercomonoides exilis TaxID=2049356 RepID=UPI0035599E2A|nr:hypothetical protein MONOS_18524 [Monocercomonoides exilis]